MCSWIPTVKRDLIASPDWLSHGPTTADTGLITAGLHTGVESVYFFKKYLCVTEHFKLQIRKPQSTFPMESEISDLSTSYFTKCQILCWGSLFPFPLCLHKSQTTQIQFKLSLWLTLVSVPFSSSLSKLWVWPMGAPMQPCMSICFKGWSENIFSVTTLTELWKIMLERFSSLLNPTPMHLERNYIAFYENITQFLVRDFILKCQGMQEHFK